MKFPLKVLSFCLIFALMGSLLSACGAKQEPADVKDTQSSDAVQTQPDEKVAIRFAHCYGQQDPKFPLYEEFIKDFQVKNPNISVTVESSPGMDHATKIKTDLAGNNTPDLFNYWSLGWLTPVINSNQVADLTDTINSDPELKDRFLEGAYECGLFDGKMYGIPAEAFFCELFVNSELFKKYNLTYPKTYDELKNVITVFKSNNIIPFAEAGKGGDPAENTLSGFLYKVGGKSLNDDVIKNGDFSSVIKGCTYFQELVKLGAFPEGVNGMNGDEKMALFNDEKAAMMYDGSWMIGAVKPEIASKIDFIPLPNMPESKADPSGLTGGIGLSYLISTNAAKDELKKAAVIKLIKYLTSDEAIKILLEKTANPPIVKLDLSTVNITPLMAKALKVRFDAKEMAFQLHDAVPANVLDKFLLETQAQIEALRTPESFADAIKEELKK